MESADLVTGRVVMVMVFSAESHSWIVTIFRAGGGMWRCVSRAFFRWWKSPSVRVYLRVENTEIKHLNTSWKPAAHTSHCVWLLSCNRDSVKSVQDEMQVSYSLDKS